MTRWHYTLWVHNKNAICSLFSFCKFFSKEWKNELLLPKIHPLLPLHQIKSQTKSHKNGKLRKRSVRRPTLNVLINTKKWEQMAWENVAKLEEKCSHPPRAWEEENHPSDAPCTLSLTHQRKANFGQVSNLLYWFQLKGKFSTISGNVWNCEISYDWYPRKEKKENLIRFYPFDGLDIVREWFKGWIGIISSHFDFHLF
jgi:hypothetical protein